MLALAAVIVLGHLLGKLLKAVGQPPVIARFSPASCSTVDSWTLRSGDRATGAAGRCRPSLGILAQIGVVLYMFRRPELNGDLLRGRAHVTILTSHSSIVTPFLLGAGLTLYLYTRLFNDSPKMTFTSVALFMGAAMSITAFPVLARILTDRRMSTTELGVLALTCAAVDDVTAWCLLAAVVGIAQARSSDALQVVLLAAAFVAAMFVVARPLVGKLVSRSGDREPTRDALVLLCVGALLSALITEGIGIHAVFGAFLFGAIIPHDSKVAVGLRDRLQDLVTIFLLPAFFAFTGMRTQIGLLSRPSDWIICGVIIIVATIGKFGGTLFASRVAGMSWGRSAALGILMNTRGLMELIVLNAGLDLGVISPKLFTMMVLMALVTTVMTTPVLHLLRSAPPLVPVDSEMANGSAHARVGRDGDDTHTR